MATIVGVEYIPTCKMLSLVVVFTLVSQNFHVQGKGLKQLAAGEAEYTYA